MHLVRALVASLLLAACSSSEEASAPPPPPLPTAPVVPTPEAPAAEAPEAAEPVAQAPSEKPRAPASEAADDAKKPPADKAASKPGASLYDLAKEGKATLPAPKPSTPSPKPAEPTKPSPGTITKPEPGKPNPGTITKPEPKPVAPKGKVTIPSTANVKVTVPAGLQAALDADPRMQSWVNQVVSIADACYKSERAKNPAAEGTIQLRVTLHENERPDGDVQSVPTPLAGVFTCGSTKLMRVKMPFFSGPEQKHTVKITFTK